MVIWPKSAATRSNWKNPISPQLTDPIITNISAIVYNAFIKTTPLCMILALVYPKGIAFMYYNTNYMVIFLSIG